MAFVKLNPLVILTLYTSIPHKKLKFVIAEVVKIALNSHLILKKGISLILKENIKEHLYNFKRRYYHRFV